MAVLESPQEMVANTDSPGDAAARGADSICRGLRIFTLHLHFLLKILHSGILQACGKALTSDNPHGAEYEQCHGGRRIGLTVQ